MRRKRTSESGNETNRIRRAAHDKLHRWDCFVDLTEEGSRSSFEMFCSLFSTDPPIRDMKELSVGITRCRQLYLLSLPLIPAPFRPSQMSLKIPQSAAVQPSFPGYQNEGKGRSGIRLDVIDCRFHHRDAVTRVSVSSKQAYAALLPETQSGHEMRIMNKT